MKNLRRTFTVLFAAAFSMQMLAQREDKLINQDWSFRFSHQVNANAAPDPAGVYPAGRGP